MKSRSLATILAALAAFTFTFNLQAALVTIETVTVGDAGNSADTTGYGAVADVFAIGKYEVTISQYNTFLNSVAAVTSDSYIVDLWNANMTNPIIAGISRSGSGTLGDPYSYSVIGSGNRPIAYVNWFDAARFANWVNNGATNGASTETGAYTLNGATNGVGFAVNPGATWFLPSLDQWYKAAYYKGGGTNAGYWLYPTQSDATPGNVVGGATNQANYRNDAGVFSVTQSGAFDSNQNYLTDAGAFSNSAGPYGTFDQAGNLWEWNDAVYDGSYRGFRGSAALEAANSSLMESSFNFGYNVPETESHLHGFRLAAAAASPAAVPEPGQVAASLLLLSGIGGYLFLKRRKAAKATV